ncbi:MAG: hypothetical protein F6K48_29535 [Okeania sp. SIO3H1]|uniref:hypothetical protein n=1 Tax=Okeania sp. SIO1I7 TaxID=2607772 RepID=UPI0013C86784|nr:hypothetical protein [Okeania sp. SIO1I7]NEN92816.1 hypothetical protein [Okeania sp. SIO3H1]NET24936.1 hypothetical protein [Okeania sp. SIO1I7]
MYSRRKKEEGRRKKEEGRRKEEKNLALSEFYAFVLSASFPLLVAEKIAIKKIDNFASLLQCGMSILPVPNIFRFFLL